MAVLDPLAYVVFLASLIALVWTLRVKRKR